MDQLMGYHIVMEGLLKLQSKMGDQRVVHEDETVEKMSTSVMTISQVLRLGSMDGFKGMIGL